MTDEKHEKARLARMGEWGKNYLARIEGSYTRAIGSERVSMADQRQRFDMARNSPEIAMQLYLELQGKSRSKKHAMEQLLTWGKRFV